MTRVVILMAAFEREAVDDVRVDRTQSLVRLTELLDEEAVVDVVA